MRCTLAVVVTVALEELPPLVVGAVQQRLVAGGEEVEGDERGGCLGGEPANP